MTTAPPTTAPTSPSTSTPSAPTTPTTPTTAATTTTVSEAPPDTVRVAGPVPHVVGLTLDEAVARLEAEGLRADHDNLACFQGPVVVDSQVPAAGESAGPGMSVSLALRCSV